MNASYVYGLQIVTAHMKRALGAVTTWDTFKKMTEAASSEEAARIQRKAHEEEAGKVKVAPHVHAAALPHSHEDWTANVAIHGSEAKNAEHHGPGDAHV